MERSEETSWNGYEDVRSIVNDMLIRSLSDNVGNLQGCFRCWTFRYCVHDLILICAMTISIEDVSSDLRLLVLTYKCEAQKVSSDSYN